MAINQEIKDRIFSAADELYAASEDGEFPSVEAVRKLSRAGMANVVECMKEWRAKQRKQVQAVREPLPGELHSLLQAAGQNMWEVAQQRANESLETARAAFEAEKADLVELSAQQSAAFDEQAVLLEAAQVRIRELEGQAATDAARLDALEGELGAANSLARELRGRMELAEQKALDSDSRAADLRAELDRAHQEADRNHKQHAQVEGERDSALQQLAAVKGELASLVARAEADAQRLSELKVRVSQAEADRDASRQAEIAAREAVASQGGKVEALEKQNAALLAAMRNGEGKAKGK